jgi:thiamine-phosphate pyrophosphorylase
VNRALLRLLVIADLGPEGRPPDPGRVRAACRGGATLIELRGKGADARDLFAAAVLLRPVCREHGVPLLVNDRPDVARTAEADGCHVGPQDLPPARARVVLGRGILGVSARTVERARAAARDTADYLGTGALRATPSKTDAVVIGWEGVEAIVRAVSLPVVVLGGVLPEDGPRLKAAGAAGIAVLRGVLGDPDPEAAARRYRTAWEA